LKCKITCSTASTNNKSANKEGNAKSRLSNIFQKWVDGSFEDIIGFCRHYTTKEIGLRFEDYNFHVLLYYH
jgi:hypothetical protein